jgi:hypothetical protein
MLGKPNHGTIGKLEEEETRKANGGAKPMWLMLKQGMPTTASLAVKLAISLRTVHKDKEKEKEELELTLSTSIQKTILSMKEAKPKKAGW